MLQTEFETAPEGAATALELVALRRQIDALELRFSQLAASFDASRYWDYDCSNSAMDWIRFNCRMTSTAAADRISSAGIYRSSLSLPRRWGRVISASPTSP